MDKICEHDKREIEKLKQFKEEVMKQIERQKDMSYEERIADFIKRLRGDFYEQDLQTAD